MTGSDSTALTGRHVLVLRSAERAKDLVERLESLGVRVTAIPVIRAEALPLQSDLRLAVSEVRSNDWVVFTSANTVAALVQTAGEQFFGALRRRQTRVAVVGPATARALDQLKVEVDLVPERQSGSGLVKAMVAIGPGRVLLPQSDLAGEVLAEGLRSAGFVVTPVTVYRTVADRDEAARATQLLINREVDIVIFSSPSTMSALSDVYDGRLSELFTEVGVVCMGERTADAARDAGIKAWSVAGQPGTEGLISAVIESSRRLARLG